jgi:histidinol-phosphate aminotransferase
VAPRPVADGLRAVAIPFAVSGLVQAAALAALDAADDLLARCAEVTVERDRVRAELLAAGYRVPVSQANFVWLPLAADTPGFDAHCLSRGIVVRAFPPDGVRVTIGLPAENDAFLAAARAFCGRSR